MSAGRPPVSARTGHSDARRRPGRAGRRAASATDGRVAVTARRPRRAPPGRGRCHGLAARRSARARLGRGDAAPARGSAPAVPVTTGSVGEQRPARRRAGVAADRRRTRPCRPAGRRQRRQAGGEVEHDQRLAGRLVAQPGALLLQPPVVGAVGAEHEVGPGRRCRPPGRRRSAGPSRGRPGGRPSRRGRARRASSRPASRSTTGRSASRWSAQSSRRCTSRAHRRGPARRARAAARRPAGRRWRPRRRTAAGGRRPCRLRTRSPSHRPKSSSPAVISASRSSSRLACAAGSSGVSARASRACDRRPARRARRPTPGRSRPPGRRRRPSPPPRTHSSSSASACLHGNFRLGHEHRNAGPVRSTLTW